MNLTEAIEIIKELRDSMQDIVGDGRCRFIHEKTNRVISAYEMAIDVMEKTGGHVR